MSGIATGVWPASLTPLNSDLSIDHGALEAHVRDLLDQGSAGVAVLGTTGEANSFSLQERIDLITRLGKQGLEPKRVLVGTGCCAAPDTIALTRAALDAGFHNMLMLPPFYYKGVSDDGLFAAYARAIEALNEPRLRVIIYDIPPQVGFALSTALLQRLREAFPETVIGVKNSSGEWSAMEATLQAMPGFKMFAGSEQFLLANLRAGGPGCISALANVTAGELAQLNTSWRDASADAAQTRAAEIRQALKPYPTIAALKQIMAQRTRRDAWLYVRAPLTQLSAAEAQSLIAKAHDLALL